MANTALNTAINFGKDFLFSKPAQFLIEAKAAGANVDQYKAVSAGSPDWGALIGEVTKLFQDLSPAIADVESIIASLRGQSQNVSTTREVKVGNQDVRATLTHPVQAPGYLKLAAKGANFFDSHKVYIIPALFATYQGAMYYTSHKTSTYCKYVGWPGC